MRAFSSPFCISIFILFSYSEHFSQISTYPSNPVATAKLLDEQSKMGLENMSGNNSRNLQGIITQDWNLTQSFNDGSPMNANPTQYPPQNPALTGFEPEAPYHSVNTSHPSANMPNMHNMHNPMYNSYVEPSPITFNGNQGPSYMTAVPAPRPQAPQAFSHHQAVGQHPFSPNSLQTPGAPQLQPYQWPRQPVQQPLIRSPNGAGQNAPSGMIYQGTYQHPPLAPAGQALPAVHPPVPLESQKPPRREKRAREESDSEEPPPKKKKGGKRPRVKEPPPAYNRRYPRPPSWGEASDGSPLFVYNDDGELRTDRKYTAEEIRLYIEKNPRRLRILVQQSPTQVAHRLGNRNTCMWKGCIKQGHKIDTGFFRIAFDEFYKQSKRGHRDPLRPAAVMHMWCYEQCFDPLVDYHDYKLKADKRPLTKETRNMIGIANKGKHIVRDAFKPWLKKTEFTERAREYTGSLSSALNEYHLSTRSSRKLALAHERSKKTGECIINFHKGDLMLFCQDTGKNKQNMKQKDLPANRFQFRPRPVRLRAISVDEDSDSSDSEREIFAIYAAQGGAVAQPEEPSNALKPLSEKSLNSRIPAAGVGARRESSRPEAYGAENKEPKGPVGDVVQDGKTRKITCEKAPSDENKPPVFETSAASELVYTDPGSCPEADGAENEEPKGSMRDGVQDDKIREIVCENPLSVEFEPSVLEDPAGSESIFRDLLSPSDFLTEDLGEGTTSFTDDLFGERLGDTLESSILVDQSEFGESSAPEEQREPKVPELKLPQPKAPEPKEQQKLKLPVPIEPLEPKQSPGVEDLSGSGGSQGAEAEPR
ncbi:unnamed protein product [Clonostachys rhizophaga]|uniref:Uncharacterized protein n=1 Tax=Clonostachys rhizophaga TaxID=160324 RepID=A0A9N9VUJ5_9HYPO|nr:unnamed protein product [Clonostachys rhizophaga]